MANRTSSLVPAADDPAPAQAWEVIYSDSFDRECPPSTQVSGHGVIPGFVELWCRFLHETVRPEGRAGFSHFELWFDGGPIRVGFERVDFKQAATIRRWVFGSLGPTTESVYEQADKELLHVLARAHARMRTTNGAAAAIVACAESIARVGSAGPRSGAEGGAESIDDDRDAFATRIAAL